MNRPAELWRRIQDAAERLRIIGSDDPRREAEYLAAHALGLRNRGEILLRQEDPSPAEGERFERLVRRRLAREPLQYILGSVPFRDIDIEVGPGVLIPRPETEVLVERVLHWLRTPSDGEGAPGGPTGIAADASSSTVATSPSGVIAHGSGVTADRTSVTTSPSRGTASPSGGTAGPSGGTASPSGVTAGPSGATPSVDRENRWIVDVGTGTGAILLSLLNQLPGWRGIGIDRSVAALAYARRNRDRYAALRERSVLVCADLLAPFRPVPLRPVPLPLRPVPLGSAPPPGAATREHRPRLGVPTGSDAESSASISAIVSNPPYVPTRELSSLAPEVIDHEPRIALDGGEDGLVFVRAILDQSSRLLEPGGLIAFELALGQPPRVAELLGKAGFDPLEIFRDLTGRERGVIARKGLPRRI